LATDAGENPSIDDEYWSQIVSNGPYKSVADLYAIKGLTEPQKAVIKKNEARLYAGPPEAAYVIDRINNGLYR
jgi:photosystem II PsbU protein